MSNNENDVNIFAKYNIVNLLFFIILCIIVCCLIFNYDFHLFKSLYADIVVINNKSESSQRTTILFYILTMISIIGYYAVTSNNEMNNRKELLPPTILAFLLYNIFSILLLVIAYSLNWAFPTSYILIAIAIILSIIISFSHVIPASLNYLKTLNIGDYFAIEKISKFQKKSKNNYIEYITKVLTIIGILAFGLLIIFTLFAIFGFAQNTINISALDFEAYAKQLEKIFIQGFALLHIAFFICLLLIPGFNKEVIKEDKKEEY